jgi:hypothetical protein
VLTPSAKTTDTPAAAKPLPRQCAATAAAAAAAVNAPWHSCTRPPGSSKWRAATAASSTSSTKGPDVDLIHDSSRATNHLGWGGGSGGINTHSAARLEEGLVHVQHLSHKLGFGCPMGCPTGLCTPNAASHVTGLLFYTASSNRVPQTQHGQHTAHSSLTRHAQAQQHSSPRSWQAAGCPCAGPPQQQAPGLQQSTYGPLGCRPLCLPSQSHGGALGCPRVHPNHGSPACSSKQGSAECFGCVRSQSTHRAATTYGVLQQTPCMQTTLY